jgi:hypothetical protein
MTTLNQPKQATTYPGSTAEKRLKIASYVLIAVGIVDLIRGFMHTFNIHYAASNYLTGVFAILIGLKAKELAPLILAIIPVTYLLGVISLRMNDVQASAAFNGQYMMFVYLAICVLAALYYYVPKWLGKDSTVISDEA